MERTAAASALTGRNHPAAPLSGIAWRDAFTYEMRVARPSDDEEVRGLLRGSAFAGNVRLSLEREPDSALAGSIEGDVHATIVARHQRTGVLAAIASRSVRDAFLNGAAARLGYFGQLRVDPRYRQRPGLLRAGFEFCHRIHEQENDATVYLASVVADNAPARRLLARRSARWPRFEPTDTLVTLALPLGRRSRAKTPGDVMLHPGSAFTVDEIVSCLQRNLARFQFAPRWTAGDFSSNRTRGLDAADFVVATRQGTVIGCAACWDQRAFKQAVVRGYSPRLARWRPLINCLSPIAGTPVLPAAGRRFEFAFISHLAADEDDGDVLASLISAVCERARARGVDHVALALSGRNPALRTVRPFLRARSYESILYLAFWPDGEALARSLDARPSHPEVAIL